MLFTSLDPNAASNPEAPPESKEGTEAEYPKQLQHLIVDAVSVGQQIYLRINRSTAFLLGYSHRVALDSIRGYVCVVVESSGYR